MNAPISRSLLLWPLCGLALALAPHTTRIELGLTISFTALVLWRVLGAYGYLPLPTRAHRTLWVLKQVLALIAFLVIYASYRGQIGRDAGIALLTVLLGLKVLELERERDYYVVSFVSYFLVVTNFFYTQSIVTALYMLAVVAVITAGLVRFNTEREQFTDFECLRLASILSAQALPIMVAAFLMFPRLPGPLWGLPQDAFSAVTGLSDTMTIGHITALGVSDEIAFRAEFEGELPKAADRYWRGPVLWESDGRTWRTGEVGLGLPHAVIKRGLEYHYSVLLEPTGERWLLGLDAVTQTGTSASVQADQSLRSKDAIKRRLRYQLSSATSYGLLEITPRERAAALALPRHRHTKAIALARTWAAASDPNAVMTRALDYFAQNGFTYTLLPPALPGDSVDQFLFETRAGFCEHFAAAYTILMRAAGLPARIVTGYQGGEFNDVSDYLTIRQRDAHAWVEVYLPRRGWTRVDPTAVVAPSRLSQGIASFTMDRSPLTILDRDGAAFKAWRSAAAWWGAMNFEWAQWVLGYSPQRQMDFFRGLGWDDVDPGDLMFCLTGAVGFVLSVLALMTLRRRDRDPIDRAYTMFCRKLARIRFTREPHEGPLHYARRVSTSRPDLRADVEQITALYTALRYADAKLDPLLLTRRVRAFSPQRRDSQPSA